MASKSPQRPRFRKTSKAAKSEAAPRNARKSHDKPKTKLAAVVAALSAPKGATLAQLMKVTGCQSHSVRGAMSGALRKQRGLKITSSKVDDERVYRIENKK